MPLDMTWKPVHCGCENGCGIWKDLGYEAKVCPTCGAHIRNGICLNTCHLSRASQERFAALMAASAKRAGGADRGA